MLNYCRSAGKGGKVGGSWTVIKWGVRNWYDEMVLFVAVGFVSFVFQVPFALVSYVFLGLPPDRWPIYLGLLMPFIPSPALIGMYALARELANNRAVNWAIFWSVTRGYLRRTLALWFVSTVVSSVFFFVVNFYLASDGLVFNIIGYAVFYCLVLWLVMQLYLLPLLLEQERWNPLRVYRNAFVLLALKPLLSLGLLIFSLLMLVLGIATVIGMPIITIPVMAVVSAHTVQYAVYGPPQKPAD